MKTSQAAWLVIRDFFFQFLTHQTELPNSYKSEDPDFRDIF